MLKMGKSFVSNSNRGGSCITPTGDNVSKNPEEGPKWRAHGN